MQAYITNQLLSLYKYYLILSKILVFNTVFLVFGELIFQYLFKKKLPTNESFVSIVSGFLLIASQAVLKQLIFLPMMFWCFDHRLINMEISTTMWVTGTILACFMQWFSHLLYHRVRFMWCFHVVHHSAKHMNFSTALRNSALDIVPIDFLFLLIPLLGVQPVVYYIIYSTYKTWGMFIHISDEYFPNKDIPFLKNLIATPLYHRVHHASNAIYIDKNYSETLPILDKIFGTYQPYTEPIIFGVAKNIPDENLKDVHLHEFRRMWADMKDAPNFIKKIKIVFGKVT